MKKYNICKIFLALLFITALSGSDYAYGMFDGKGQWICSREIEIELSYYESYTDTFQNVIDEIFLAEGPKMTQSYFESVVKEERAGQDWKRSQDCLIELGIDIAELPQIVIPKDQTQDPSKDPILTSTNDTSDLISSGGIQSIEKIQEKTEYDSYYVGITIFFIAMIIALSYYYKSRKKHSSPSKTDPKTHSNNDTKDEENHENVEIEVRGGIEK
ncbi:MAG: hypothetical protein OEL84_00675 [Nitrosopumilus sp.]|nr:hypothetical protein [Nitrosopumilus sp.]